MTVKKKKTGKTPRLAAAGFKFIKKRDGRIMPFDVKMIAGAIYKASSAVGAPDRKLADELGREVLARLRKKITGKGAIPTVEGVQDMVEQVLIDSGRAKIAKAYILYRERRAEIRQEKKQILNKGEIDEVDKRFDINALRVLAARYLRKDDSGTIIETPKELFIRVAVHATLPSLFYDHRVYDGRGGEQEHRPEEFEPEKFEGKFSLGRYKLNRFHLEALKRLFDHFNEKRRMKISWSNFLEMLKKHQFADYEKEAERYYDLMATRRFMPNTPALANFGSFLGMGSACFVLGIEDSIDSIMDKLKAASIIFKAGGGVGYNFSQLRPEGDYIKSTGGAASGPISFMTMFDNMTDVIKQGGIRRGANMGILNINHPDIEKFIKSKEGNQALRNFNISVLVMPDFFEHYRKNQPYPLVNPRTGKIVRHVDPRKLFDLIAYQAWESAEPGVIFHDRINEHNPFNEHLGPIVTTNPCGEVLLYPYESCNLGSVNVWSFVRENANGKKHFAWDELAETVKAASFFLDNVIDVNKYPMPEIKEMTMSTRKIGLGVMGVGDLLYDLEISYNSKEGLEFMERLMEFVNYHSKIASIELARKRGKMPFYDKSFYSKGRLPFAGYKDKKSRRLDWSKISRDVKRYGIRNGYTTVVAPTGSISMIAGCSSGIEPVYSLVFEKNVSVGSFFYVDPVFEWRMQKEGLMDEALLKDVVALRGSVQKLSYIPAKLKKAFITAMDIVPADHIRALAAFQKWVDSSISKTNNFPATATVGDMVHSYMLAYELGCKGVTVFRDTSIKNQVLVSGSKKKEKEKEREAEPMRGMIALKDEKARGLAVYHEAGVTETNGLGLSPASAAVKDGEKKCPMCSAALAMKEGCKSCPACGWGVCV